jgi:acyl-coenzyme A thioesterase PaaI-like protein
MKPIRADRYLLVRAQAVKQEGRKTYVNISVEDGEGTIFARGTALYVKPKMLPTAVLLSATQ